MAVEEGVVDDEGVAGEEDQVGEDGDGDREKMGDEPVECCGVGGGVCAGLLKQNVLSCL